MKTNFKAAFLCLLSIAFLQTLNAQELTQAQAQLVKQDDLELFKKEFTKDNYSQCYDIKESTYSLLAICIKIDSPKIFDYLLENGAKVNDICDDKTPLMFAAKYGKEDYALKLLKKGADKNITNSKGKTAKDYAEKNNYASIAEMLK